MLATIVVLGATIGNAGADDTVRALDAIRGGNCVATGEAINAGLAKQEAGAYFLAGFLYADTGCVATDYARAARFYQQAAELGSKPARKALGLMYGMGVGVPQDYAIAYHWFRFRQEGDPVVEPLKESTEAAAGFAYTVVERARAHATFPTTDRYTGGSPGTVLVTFHVHTRSVEFSDDVTGFDDAHGKQGYRAPDFPNKYKNAVSRAYEQAVLEVPPLTALGPDEFGLTVPWTFGY